MAKQDHSKTDEQKITEGLTERLRQYRGRIDQLDKEIVRLLNDRASRALELRR